MHKRRCHHCGKHLHHMAKHCHHCGVKVAPGIWRGVERGNVKLHNNSVRVTGSRGSGLGKIGGTRGRKFWGL